MSLLLSPTFFLGSRQWKRRFPNKGTEDATEAEEDRAGGGNCAGAAGGGSCSWISYMVVRWYNSFKIL